MSEDRSCQVYIGYLPNDARMEDVEDFFKGYGKIKSVNLKPGYGFVDFEDLRDAEDAVRVSEIFRIFFILISHSF